MNNATMKMLNHWTTEYCIYAKSKYHNNERCSQEFYQNHTRPIENVTGNRSHLSIQNMKIMCGGYTPAKNICSQILLFVS